jgi:hypothetical protein
MAVRPEWVNDLSVLFNFLLTVPTGDPCFKWLRTCATATRVGFEADRAGFEADGGLDARAFPRPGAIPGPSSAVPIALAASWGPPGGLLRDDSATGDRKRLRFPWDARGRSPGRKGERRF